MSSENEVKLKFIQEKLPILISQQGLLRDEEVVECIAESKAQLDGFMSSIFKVQLKTRDGEGR